jgi:hypothetical protein
MSRCNLSTSLLDIVFERHWAENTDQISSCCFSIANMHDFPLVLASTSTSANEVPPGLALVTLDHMNSDNRLIRLDILN